MPVKYYTEDEYQDKEEKLGTLINTTYVLLRYFSELDKKKNRVNHPDYDDLDNTNNVDKCRWEYIPLEVDVTIRDLFIVENYLRKKKKWSSRITFIDAGCGIGFIPLLAHKMGMTTYGIELNKDNYKVASAINKYAGTITQGDILKHDFSKYNIVFYYCPIRKEELQRKFERKVENEVKKGSIIIAHNKQDQSIYKDKRFKKITGHIWEKVKE